MKEKQQKQKKILQANETYEDGGQPKKVIKLRTSRTLNRHIRIDLPEG